MATIYLAGTKKVMFRLTNLELDEFVPVVKFDRTGFSRPDSTGVKESADPVNLSDRLEAGKRAIKVISITMLPGKVTFPFQVEKGLGTWDDLGFIEAKIEPPTSEVKVLSGGKPKVKYGDGFSLELEIAGHAERSFNIDFYANDDEDFNQGEYRDIHCGRIEIRVAGTSRVGARLIENIDALPDAPAGYIAPKNNTRDPKEIALSQRQANQYNDCLGVCYATSASRAQKAYRDLFGTDIIDLTVNNANLDHRIASTQGGTTPYMGYGAGGPFARRGYGQTVAYDKIWEGDLRRGSLLQVWHSIDREPAIGDQLYIGGGHSVIFRNYLYDDEGNICALQYTDYHGGIRKWERAEYEPEETILGVNLLDSRQ